MGLMLGIKLKSDSRAFVAYMRTHGLLAVAAGDNVVRVLPPLVIEDSHIREFVDKLSDAARNYEVSEAACPGTSSTCRTRAARSAERRVGHGCVSTWWIGCGLFP